MVARHFPSSMAMDIWLAKSDGSVQKKLTSSGSAWSPSWSPDGTRVAFLSEQGMPSNRFALWLMGSDGSDPRRITPDDLDVSYADSPSWSPDSQQIVFTAYSAASRRQGVYIVSIDSGQASLILTGVPNAAGPAWQPCPLMDSK
jgi:TolB protein